jgi:putative sterol carrier protein
LLGREQGVMAAYLTGKLKLSGDLGAAMQLSKLLS